MWISEVGGGRRMWIKKFLNVNIINFEKVDKPEGSIPTFTSLRSFHSTRNHSFKFGVTPDRCETSLTTIFGLRQHIDSDQTEMRYSELTGLTYNYMNSSCCT